MKYLIFTLAILLTGCGKLGTGGDSEAQSNEVTTVSCSTRIETKDYEYTVVRYPNGDVDTLCKVGVYSGQERLGEFHRFADEGICFIDTPNYYLEFYIDSSHPVFSQPTIVVEHDPQGALTFDSYEFDLDVECRTETVDVEGWARDRINTW